MTALFSPEYTRYWIIQKSLELLLFIIVFLSTNAFLDGKNIVDSFALKVSLGIAITYGLICFYWPVTWLLTYFGKYGFKSYQTVEISFFIFHSFIFLSLSYGAFFGLSRNINYISPMVLGWASILIVNLIFLFFGKNILRVG